MDGKQLKNSILQWAIQGKLVPQNPKDEPASKLLERIAESRNESSLSLPKGTAKGTKSKDPGRKKSAQSSRIYRENGVWYEQVGTATPKDISDEIPFEIPKNWTWCRLKDYLDVRDGTHDSPKYYSSGIPFVTSKNLVNGQIDFSNVKYISQEDHEAFSARSKVDDNDILFAMIGSIGNPVLVKKTCDFSIKNVALFKPYNEETDMHYMLLYFQHIQTGLKKIAAGGVQSFISLNVFRNWLFPLPPLAEQKRIVAKLEQVLPLAEEYGTAQEQLNTLNKELPEALKKSILQEAIQGKLVPQNPKDEPAQKLLERIAASRNESSLSLPKGTSSTSLRGAKATKQSKNPPSRIYRENGVWYEQIGTATPKDVTDEIPFEIPETWAWCRMGNIGSWGAGATPAKGNPAFYKNGEIPWLVTGELNNSVVTETKTKISKVALEKCSLRLCKPGDVLIAMYGATIGKLAIAGIELTTNQACCACTPHYEYNKYLFYFLMASKPDLIKRGEGGAQPNISKEKLINYLMPLPPLAEQKRIVAKLEQLFKVL